jgi:hypothetical protein
MSAPLVLWISVGAPLRLWSLCHLRFASLPEGFFFNTGVDAVVSSSCVGTLWPLLDLDLCIIRL